MRNNLLLPEIMQAQIFQLHHLVRRVLAALKDILKIKSKKELYHPRPKH